MLFMRPKLGFFGVDTPGEHDKERIHGFKAFMEKYGHWLAEHFIALTYPEPEHGPFPAVRSNFKYLDASDEQSTSEDSNPSADSNWQ
jgi:hypothetical protein